MHALILAAAITVVHVPQDLARPDCLPRPQVVSGAAPLGAQRLGSLPDANEVRAVLRTVNGCSYQEVVAFNVLTHAPGPTDGRHVPGWSGTLIPDGAHLTPATPASR